MTPGFLVVPADFAARTVSREQEAGRDWIDGLPGVVEHLTRYWDLTLTGPPMAGTVGLVWEVSRRDGSRCVLKVSWQDPETAGEAAALRRWDGEGAVRLVASSDEAGALLLEGLDARTSLASLEMGEAVGVAAGLLRQLHVPDRSGFADALEQESSSPDRSDAYGGRIARLRPDVERAFRDAPHVLLHGDFHYANVLWSGTSWRAIDPKPVHGPREWDLVPLLRNRFDEYRQGAGQVQGVQDRLRALVVATGADAARAALFAHYRALKDADYARRVGDSEFERVSNVIAVAADRSGGSTGALE